MKRIIKSILHKLISGKKGFSDLTVLSGQARGIKLRIDLRKEASYFLGTYDQWIFKRINFSNYIKPGMCLWDCGAYIGYYTAVFRNCIKDDGLIYTFEASYKNYNSLKELPNLNNWENVKIINIAVGPENSKIQFSNNLGGSNGPVGLSKIYSHDLEIIEVDCKGVDEIIALGIAYAPDFIKFDIESAEIYALNNGDNLFSTKRPLILLEIHGEEAFKSTGLFLEKYNYRAAYVGDFPDPEKWYHSGSDLKEIGFIPHMLFCFPN
ncbi:MAG: FkbM family methyltransferase [Bacteroidota bacterium]|nr:FkbM family methyltransferase [Bacteroidota bacterium]